MMKSRSDEFIQRILEIEKTDPAVFISAYAQIHIMRNETPDLLFASYYPRSLFEEAIRRTEDAAVAAEKECREDADSYRASAEFIRTHWLNRATAA